MTQKGACIELSIYRCKLDDTGKKFNAISVQKISVKIWRLPILPMSLQWCLTLETEKQTATEDKVALNGSERRRKFILEKCQNIDDDKDFNYFSELTEDRPKSNSASKLASTKDLCLIKEYGECHDKLEEIRSTSGIASFQGDSSSYHGKLENLPQKR